MRDGGTPRDPKAYKGEYLRRLLAHIKGRREAVAVASDEVAGGGCINEWKRDRLLRAGADMVIADFMCRDGLVRLLFGA